MRVCLDDVFQFQPVLSNAAPTQNPHKPRVSVCAHPGTQPASSPGKRSANKPDNTRWCLLQLTPLSLTPRLPRPRVSACRDLVFLFLSVRSRFYCAIFCHFGPRKGGRNAISPPLRPLLRGRVAWPVCWAGEKGERRGQGEL